MRRIAVTIKDFTTASSYFKYFTVYFNFGSKPWRINLNSTKFGSNKIYFKSNTIDKIADILYTYGFLKIKGPKIGGYDWHITFDCNVSSNIMYILGSVDWYLTRVTMQNEIHNGMKNFYSQSKKQYPTSISISSKHKSLEISLPSGSPIKFSLYLYLIIGQ